MRDAQELVTAEVQRVKEEQLRVPSRTSERAFPMQPAVSFQVDEELKRVVAEFDREKYPTLPSLE
jgi:hypothetical protein